MVEKVSNWIVNGLISDGRLNKLQEEECVYGLTCFIETAIGIGFLLLIGAICDAVFPTIFFILFFSAIRKRSGGFHASTYLICLVSSITAFTLFALLIAPIMTSNMSASYVALIVSFVVIEIIGAVNNPEIGWNSTEYYVSKSLVRRIASLEFFIIMLIVYLNADSKIVVYLIVSMCFNSILLLLSIFKEVMKHAKTRFS